jgi:hypothetical protein
MDDLAVTAMARNRQHLGDLFQCTRSAVLKKAHEGFDCGQSRVTGTGAVVALRAQVIEKFRDQ